MLGKTACRLLLASALLALCPTAARAQTFNWDPTFTGTFTGGGSGIWDTTTANWFNGTADVAWPGAGNVAVFGGTSGTVTIAPGGVSADGLTFTSSGYAIGGDPLTLTGAGAITVAGTGQSVSTATIGSVIGGSVGLTKAGTGNLVLTGANTYTGATTLNGGTLTLDFNAAGAATTILNPSSGLVFGGSNRAGGTFAVNGASAGTTQSVNGVTLTSGLAIISATSNAGGAVTLNLGAITRSAGTALSFTLPAVGSITTTTANANIAGGQQTILGGYAVVGGTTPTWAVSGSGATPGAISGLATYNPVNTITAGTDIDITGATTSASTVTVNSLRLTPGATAYSLTLSNPLTVATGGVLLNPGATNTTITGSTITSGTGELIFNNYSTANGGTARELLVASQVTGNVNVVIGGVGNNGVFTQNNAGGQVELQNSNNNFTGTIYVLGGRLGNGANTITGGNAAFLGLGNATNPVVVVGTATGGGQWFMNAAQTQTRAITLSGVGWAEGGGSFGALRARGTVSGPIALAGNARIGSSNGANLSGVISGPFELALDGGTNGSAVPQTITILGTTNTWSGGTRIERGNVNMGAANALPAGTLVTFGTTYGATDTLRPEGLSPPTLNINGFATQAAGLTIEPGDTLATAAATLATVTNTGAAATLTVGGTGNFTFGGVLTNGTSALSLTKTGAGTQVLTATNFYTGATTVNQGTLTTTGSFLASSSQSGSTNATTTVTVTSTTGLAVGQPVSGTGIPAGAYITAIPSATTITISAAATATGSATFTFGAGTPLGTGAINVAAAGTLNVSGVSGGFALVGTQTLTNNGTVTGGVAVPAGTTLTGTGTYSGTVTVSGGTLTPGTATTVGSIASIGNLAVNSGTFNIKFNGASSDQIGSIPGTATFAGNGVLSISQLSAPTNTSYTILTANGGLTGLTAGLLTTIGRTTYTIDAAALSSNSLKLDIAGNPANMRWVGGGANPTRWENTQLDANWTTTDPVADTTHFYDGDLVTFNNNNNGNFTVNVTGTVRPGSITVANTGGTTYTFADGGSGVIAGNTGLTMTSDGTGTLVIGTHNTFSGPVSITGGTVSISSSDNLGNGAAGNSVTLAGGTLRATATLDLGATRPVTLGSGGGTLDVALSTTLTVSGAVGGAGTGDALTKSGAGTLVLSGTSTYAGPTVISAGTLRVTNSASLGAVPGGAVTVASGGVLDLGTGGAANALNFGQKQFVIAGDGIAGTGAITNSAAANQQNALQRVRLSADASVGGANRFDIRAPQVGGVNTAQLDLQGHTLTKNGTFFFPLVATDVTDGNIVVNGGTFSFETTTNVPAGTGTITFNTGTTWSFFGFTGTLARPVVVNGAVTVGPNNNAVSTAASPITLNGDLTASALNANSTGTVVLNGVISETGGAHSITKVNNVNASTGTSVLVLGGNNTFSGGVNVNGGIVEISTVNNLGTGPLTFGGGTLRFATGSGGADVSVRPVTLNTGGGTIDTNGNSVTFANPIGNNGAGGLTKAGAGTLALNAANTYGGGTTVAAGRLLANNTAGSGTGSGAVTVTGGTLGGTGTINPGANAVSVQSGGQLFAGTGTTASTLTINTTGTVSLAANSVLGVRITDGSTPSSTAGGSTQGTLPNPTSNNFLSVTGSGTLSIDPGLLITIDGTGTAFTLNSPYSYFVGKAPSFASAVNITNPAQFSTVGFSASNFSLTSDGLGDLVLSFTPVPEPAALLAVCAAALAGGGLLRRRSALRGC
jgi:autotransporter-associated beta strand protein